MSIIVRILVACAIVFVGFVAPAMGQELIPIQKVDGNLDRADLVMFGGWASSPDPAMSTALVRIVGGYYTVNGQWFKATLYEGLANNYRSDVGQKSFTFPSDPWWFKGFMTQICAEVADYRILDEDGNPYWAELPGCKIIIARGDEDKRPSVNAFIAGKGGKGLHGWGDGVDFTLLRKGEGDTYYEAGSDQVTGSCFVNEGAVSCWQGLHENRWVAPLPKGEYIALVSAWGYRSKFIPFTFNGEDVNLGTIELDPLFEVSIHRQDIIGREVIVHFDVEQYVGEVDVTLQIHGSTGVDTTHMVTFDADKKVIDRVGRVRRDLRFRVPANFPAGLYAQYRILVTPRGNPWSVLGQAWGQAWIER